MNLEPVTIISAELPTLDFHANSERTNDLRMELLNNGYSIVGVKVNGLQGFLVTTSRHQPLVKLALKYDQSTIYFSDKERQTSKINCLKPKAKVSLGKLLNTTKSVKLTSSDLTITFIEDGKQHVFTTEAE